MSSLDALTKAIGRLDDETYRDLVAAADGATLDALLEGVHRKQQDLIGNKTFGKGARAPKKGVLEQRLRVVLGLAYDRSSIAKEICDNPGPLELIGGGPGTDLDLAPLSRFAGLRALYVTQGGRVRGLDALTQLHELRVGATTVDLAEVAQLPLTYLNVCAGELLSASSLATGVRFGELVLTPSASPPVVRADIVRFQADAATLGPIEGEIGELRIQDYYLEHLQLGRVAGLHTLWCMDTHSLRTIEGARGLSTLRKAVITGAFDSLEFLAGCPLETLALRSARKEHAAKYTELLADHHRELRELTLHDFSFESLYELPDLPQVETLDLSGCGGFMELAGFKTKFPKLRRFIAQRTALRKQDVTREVPQGIEVVL